MMQILVASNGCQIKDAEFAVVRNGLKPLIGRNLFDVLGITVTRFLNPFV